MKGYVTPEMNIISIQYKDIIALSVVAGDDSNYIVYNKDNLSKY